MPNAAYNNLVPPTQGDAHSETQWKARITDDVNYAKSKSAKNGKKIDKVSDDITSLRMQVSNIPGLQRDVGELMRLRIMLSGAVVAIGVIGALVGWYIQSQIIEMQKVLKNAEDDHRVIVGPPPLRQLLEENTKTMTDYKAANKNRLDDMDTQIRDISRKQDENNRSSK